MSASEKRGIDGGKKVKGHKRHIIVDTQGNILYVKVHAANIHDTVSGCDVFEKVLEKYPTINGVCADSGYRKTMVNFVENKMNKTIEISKKILPGWSVIAKRWIVERTFAWFNHYRRLSKDFELSIKSSENTIIIAHSVTLLNKFKNS